MFSSIVLLGGTGDIGRRVVNLLNKTRFAGFIWSQGKAPFPRYIRVSRICFGS
jgi:hypothetical protein